MTADELGIQNVVKQLEETWNASDSRGFAGQFAEDATFIQIFGGQLDGRAAIEGSHRAIFDTIYKGSKASFAIRSIRFVRPDMVIVFTRSELKLRADSQAPEIEARPTMFMENFDSGWHIVALQNTIGNAQRGSSCRSPGDVM